VERVRFAADLLQSVLRERPEVSCQDLPWACAAFRVGVRRFSSCPRSRLRCAVASPVRRRVPLGATL